MPVLLLGSITQKPTASNMESAWAGIFLTAILGLSLWIIKKWLDDIKGDTKHVRSRLECIEKAEHACQIDNERRFATKKELFEVKADLGGELDRHASVLDDHTEKIAKLEER